MTPTRSGWRTWLCGCSACSRWTGSGTSCRTRYVPINFMYALIRSPEKLNVMQCENYFEHCSFLIMSISNSLVKLYKTYTTSVHDICVAKADVTARQCFQRIFFYIVTFKQQVIFFVLISLYWGLSLWCAGGGAGARNVRADAGRGAGAAARRPRAPRGRARGHSGAPAAVGGAPRRAARLQVPAGRATGEPATGDLQ